jgi:hypothetical protein
VAIGESDQICVPLPIPGSKCAPHPHQVTEDSPTPTKTDGYQQREDLYTLNQSDGKLAKRRLDLRQPCSQTLFLAFECDLERLQIYQIGIDGVFRSHEGLFLRLETIFLPVSVEVPSKLTKEIELSAKLLPESRRALEPGAYCRD